MKRSFYALPILLLFALLVAACGGSGGVKLQSGDIAIVGSTHVSKASYAQLMSQQTHTMKAQGQKVPKQGSSTYTSLKSQVISVLVQNAEIEAEAAKLDVTVAPKEVQAQLTALQQQYFGGSKKKYLQQVKQQGFTDAAVRDQIRLQLLEQKLFDKITADVTASSKQVTAYFDAHKSSYPPTRNVQEILVGKGKGKQALAQSIYHQLASGGSWAKLAKKYSQDPGSKGSAGKYTAQKGKDVPEFDAAVFAPKAKTGTLLQPVSTKEYGWFVIKLDGPAVQPSEKSVAPSIQAQLDQQAKNQKMTAWMKSVTKGFCSGNEIAYQPGYQPVPDPCASLAQATNTTTTSG